MHDSFETRWQDYENKIKSILQHASKKNLHSAIVNAPFCDPLMATYLDLGIVVLLLVDKDNTVINRVALSNTVQAAAAVKTSAKPFSEIVIPADNHSNIIAKAIKTGKHQQTEDWKDLFVPALSPASARFNQATAGIAWSMVEPIEVLPHGGALIFSFFKHAEVSERTVKFTRAYADMVTEALRNSH